MEYISLNLRKKCTYSKNILHLKILSTFCPWIEGNVLHPRTHFSGCSGHLILRFSGTRMRHFSRNHPAIPAQLAVVVFSDVSSSVVQQECIYIVHRTAPHPSCTLDAEGAWRGRRCERPALFCLSRFSSIGHVSHTNLSSLLAGCLDTAIEIW